VRWRSRALALALGVALAGSVVLPASAHALLTASSPPANAVLDQGPAQLTLTFNSALADSGNEIKVLHSDGTSIGALTPHSDGKAEPTETVALPTLAPDVYTVAWTSVSGVDGHVLKQFFGFVVGSVPDPIAPPSLAPLTVGDTVVNLKIARGNVGPTTFGATVTDAAGKPLANLQRVIFRYKSATLDSGPVDAIAPATGSTARTPSVVLGIAGDWDFTVIVRRVGLDDVSAPLKLSLEGVASPTPPAAPTLAPTPTTAAAATTAPTSVATTPPTLAPSPIPPTVAPPASPTSTTAAVTPTAVPPTATSAVGNVAAAEASGLPIGPIAAVAVVAIVGGIVVTRLRR
jgi:methionine-rich copper-binding protein CopC